MAFALSELMIEGSRLTTQTYDVRSEAYCYTNLRRSLSTPKAQFSLGRSSYLRERGIVDRLQSQDILLVGPGDITCKFNIGAGVFITIFTQRSDVLFHNLYSKYTITPNSDKITIKENYV